MAQHRVAHAPSLVRIAHLAQQPPPPSERDEVERDARLPRREAGAPARAVLVKISLACGVLGGDLGGRWQPAGDDPSLEVVSPWPAPLIWK